MHPPQPTPRDGSTRYRREAHTGYIRIRSARPPNRGEFVPRGAFIIRGKRNYKYHLPLELVVGEIEYRGTRKVMCGPVTCFKDCEKYFVIRPGKNKNHISGDMAKRFTVPEEEISRILPPGESEIVREVWPKENPEDWARR